MTFTFINPLNTTPQMPNPSTLRDVVPILEELRQLTKIPLVAKEETIFYKRIAEATRKLSSIDIENAIIESHASGEIGKVHADQTRNFCVEIATRIETFQSVFYKLDKERRNKKKADLIDHYESNHFLKEVEMLYMIAAHYEYALKACHKIPVPDDWTIDKYKQEIEQFHMADTREGWLEKKREFLKKLQESVEYDEFLLRPSFDVYHELRNVCRKIFIMVERYFPPCEIQLHPKCRETFIQKMQVRNGSYPAPEQPVKQSLATTKSCRQWKEELFPMILVSELYEICDEIFDDPTETQFHSSLNLHGKHEPLRIKPKQKIKVCYLISKLYDIVPEKHKVAWREDILLHFGIDSSYYESKYSHPRGSDASRSSMAFADDVDEIIKNHKKRA